MLPCIGKVFERIINKRLEHFIEHNDKLSPTQCGFQPKKSTSDVLIQLGETIEDAFMKEQYCAVIYIDLEGAFDKVWRHGLLYKLTQLGIEGQMLAWLQDYLNNQHMSVQIEGKTSI